MYKYRLILTLAGLALLAVLSSSLLFAQQHGQMRHGHPMDGGSLSQGGPGMQRMLQGTDTSSLEERELAAMFANHQLITREVTYLPDGIHAVTESDNPELAAVLVSHTVGMIDRVETGRDPGVAVQSKTLDTIFQNRDTIETTLEFTSKGIIVTQTSTDPHTVRALQVHADEVTDMVNRGMMAVMH